MNEPINCFPGYEYKRLDDGKFHNMYRGVDLGRGGWVYSEPGIYTNIALLDVASLHPSSIILMNKLGDYTSRYADLRQARVFIKHKDYNSAKKLFDGKLAKYLTNDEDADNLSSALKIPLNSFYGISTASYNNPARDSRDINNIIALRGALFMKTMFDEITSKGYKIFHVKTDSIKIANADNDIIQFAIEFAKNYGYELEHEATYDRICLVDKANYIARYDDKGIRNKGGKHANEWTATGEKYQHPYIFKMLFSGEPIAFDDLCETKNVTGGAIYLDMNEDLTVDISAETEMERRIYNRAHPDKMKKLNPEYARIKDDELSALISRGHDYYFVGRTGLFCPIKKGCGGGWMLRLKDGKYYSVTGTKDIRWLEAETVKTLGKEDDIDKEYFEKLIDDAVASIDEVGGKGAFERFIDVSQDYIPVDRNTVQRPLNDDFSGLSCVPCGDGKYHSCMDCKSFVNGTCERGYDTENYIFEGGKST